MNDHKPAHRAAAANQPHAPSPPVVGAVPLSSLREGERGRAHTAQLPCEDCDLLNAMGLTDACEVRVCRNGEPCIVQVRTTRLGLSAALAHRIFVTIERQPHGGAGAAAGAAAA